MGSLNFSLRTPTPSTPILGPTELRRDYLTGLPTGKLSDQALRGWLLAAERTVEQQLSIKLSRQLVEEDLDQFIDDPRQIFYLRTSYPVMAALSLNGGVTEAGKAQSVWPQHWLQVRKTNQDVGYERKVLVVPQGGGSGSAGALGEQVFFSGLAMQSSWLRAGLLPRYWRIAYFSGYAQVPEELVQLVGLLASIPALYKLANLVLPPGLSSQSISLDGLSQNLSTQDPYGKTIQGYLAQAQLSLQQLKGQYQGIMFEVL